MVEYDVVRSIVGLADLLQDHRALALDLLRLEGRVLQYVGEDIEGERNVFLKHLRVVGRTFARGVSVEMAADCFDLLGDGECAAPAGALEGHVLEKMRNPVDVGRLMARADIDPDAERDRVDGVDTVGRDPQSVGQSGKLRRHSIIQSIVSGTPRVGANKLHYGA